MTCLADCRVSCTGRFDAGADARAPAELGPQFDPIRIIGEARIRLFAVDGAERHDKTVGGAFVDSSIHST